jgi:dienelactone hydrolase
LYAGCRRADSIVADAEVVRKALVPRNATTQNGKWSLLGQSFGGFCALTYLSHAPQGELDLFVGNYLCMGVRCSQQ